MKSKHARWLFNGVLIAWCATMHAQGATIRIIGGAWRTFSHVSATGLLVEASADLGGTGMVHAAAAVRGSLTPGNGTNTGALAFTDAVTFEGGTLHIYAAEATVLSWIEAAGAITGTGTVAMTRATGVEPVEQVVMAGAPTSEYAAFSPSSFPNWRLGESGSLDLWISYHHPTLVIQSPYGLGTPPVGVYTNIIGTILTNTMNRLDTQGSTQFVCAGWVMSGNEPVGGSVTQVVMTVTNDAVLTWLWTTNYWLAAASGPNGSVNAGSGWQAYGVTTQLTATASQYYHFTNWTGNVAPSANPLVLLMDGPKWATAIFAVNTTTNSPVPVPVPWMAAHGLTNFETEVNDDPDHDGQKTWEEYLASESDPTNPLSYFHTEAGLGSLLISWPSATGRVYDVHVAADLPGYGWALTAWTNQPATPPMNVVTNPNSAMTNSWKFFRAVGRME